MLQNAYFLAKIGADTAENEQPFAEILPIGRRVAHRGHPRYDARDPGRDGDVEACFADPARAYARGCPGCSEVRLAKLTKLAKLANFANFWRARSRLYQNENLQENMRSTAFFKLYKICILLHRCNLNILAKNPFEKSAIFVKIQLFFQMLQILQNLQNFVKINFIFSAS